MAIKVAIVEGKTGVRERWASLLEATPGFRCVAACDNAAGALETLPKCRWDVVLMDINLPGINGIGCTFRLKQVLPEIHVLILTVCSDADRVFEALKAGASGYLLKSTPPKEFLAAITDVTQERFPMTGQIAHLVIEFFRQPAPPTSESVGLTQREKECLRMLARGSANKGNRTAHGSKRLHSSLSSEKHLSETPCAFLHGSRLALLRSSSAGASAQL